MIKAIVFDFYGVIYSNFNWNVIDRRIYSSEHTSLKFKDIINRANRGELTNDQVLFQVAKLANDDNYPNDMAVEPHPTINVVAIGLIDRLKSKYKTGLLSNGGKEQLEYTFNDFGGLDKLFDVVATSSDMPFMKPNPEAFKYVANQLGCDPGEVLMVDDSFVHVEGAKKAGLETFLFKDINGLRDKFDQLGINYA